MKFRKVWAILAIICVLCTGCQSQDSQSQSQGSQSENGSANGSGSGTLSDAVSDLTSDAQDMVSDAISGASDAISDTTDSGNVSSGSQNEANLPTGTTPTGGTMDLSDLEALENQTKGWGQGKDVDDANRPISCLQFQARYGEYDAWFIGDTQKQIYLTFDEGYENGYTAVILDVLKEKRCPAVFFVTMPYVKENPDLIRRMIKEGHVVGNHTVNHPSMPGVSMTQAVKEIEELHDYVKKNFQYEMTLFRPPMGEWSERTLAITKRMKYHTVFWSFAYKDWETEAQPDPKTALQTLTDSLHPGGIYLLHAVSSTNASILGDWIDQTKAKGYSFVSFPTM